jgi:hypothetical protein
LLTSNEKRREMKKLIKKVLKSLFYPYYGWQPPKVRLARSPIDGNLIPDDQAIAETIQVATWKKQGGTENGNRIN